MFKYDYFDEEYSEFDAQIEEFKESLRKEVKAEIKSKIDRLEKRNKELEEKQKNLATLEKEYKDKIRKLERDKEEALYEVKKEYLTSTLKELTDKMFECQDLYEVNFKRIQPQKCNYCDENRYLIAKDIFGGEHKVPCKCREYVNEYYVQKADVRICWFKRGDDRDKLCFRVKSNRDSCGWQNTTFEYINGKVEQNNIFKKFDENNLPKSYYLVWFTSKEEAQKYVDYLNKREMSGNE